MTTFFKVLVFLAGFHCCLESAQLAVEVSARSAVLMNAGSGVILYEKEKDSPAFPASTTKIATLLYALEKKSDGLDVKVTPSDLALAMMSGLVKKSKGYAIPPFYLEPDGTHMSIRRNETLPLEALFYGLMLVSANDAANTIAEYTSGSIPQFIDELNDFLKGLGCQNTHFANPHGLHHPHHYTTARDLAIIMQSGLKNPLFCRFASALQFTRPKTNIQPEMILYRTNKLFRKGKYFYPRVIAAKSGYMSDAGCTLVAAAREGERVLVAVVLGCSNDHQRYSDVIRLFDTAFNESKVSHRLFNARENLFTLSIKGAKNPLRASLKNDLAIEYYPSEEPRFKVELCWEEELHLPISKGDMVGEIQLVNDRNELLKSAPFYAIEDVQKTFLAECRDRLAAISQMFLKRRWLLLLPGFFLIGYALKRKIKADK